MASALKISCWLGVGLLATGIYLYWREKKLQGLGGHRYMAGRFAEAPVVDSYSDGNMQTVLRASPDMPIQQRIASIQKMVEKSVQDPEMRKLAGSLTRHCGDRDGMCEAKAIYKAVKKRVRYVGDIAPVKMANGDVEGIDLYQSARRTWDMQIGDCDDQTILIETLLSVIGITARSRVTAETPDADDSHIYPIALLPKFSPSYAVALDTTLPGSNKFGVEVSPGRITDFDA
jgi:hypothetical protein